MSRLNKTWTADEIDYLISAWGNVNMATITKHLDRSECAIRLKAGKLNLGPFLANGYRYITISNLYKLIRPNTSATLRKDFKGTPYFAVKFGMIAYGFIRAYEIVDEDFVRRLKSLYIESDMILKNKKG